MKSRFHLFASIFPVLLLCLSISGQFKGSTAKPASCEENGARLEKNGRSLEGGLDGHDLLIIARPGDGESSDQYKGRLHIAREYILAKFPRLHAQQIFVIDGRYRRGSGSVEFYIGES